MQLTSCSVLFSRSLADPLMSLDFADAPPGEPAMPATSVVIYKLRLDQPYRSKRDAKMPQSDEANFSEFRDQLLDIAQRVRALVEATSVAKKSNAGELVDFHGKGSFYQGQLRFRYRLGRPRTGTPQERLTAMGEPLWNEAWMRASRRDFPEEIQLPASGEPRLDPRFLVALRPNKDYSRIKPPATHYRVCFGLRCAPDDSASVSIRLLCWLHPARDQRVEASEDPAQPDNNLGQLRQRLEMAVLNNYVCEFDRLPDAGAECLRPEDRAQLFFLAVEVLNWDVADWLMSVGPGGCGVDALDRWGDTALARLCHLGGEARAIAGLMARGADRKRRDADGNSPLHRLAAALRQLADPEKYVLPALKELAGDLTPRELGSWLAEENSAGERPMTLLSNGAALDWLLERLVQGSTGSPLSPAEVQSLLSSPSGYSLVHSFAAFSQLKAAEQAVTRWLGSHAWQLLLGAATIESGRLRGYSAVHAACQEGNWSSVHYLSRQGQPAPPATAIDLAIRERHLCSYEQFRAFVRESMARPDAATALKTIDRAEDCLATGSPIATEYLAPAVEFRLQRAAPQVENHCRDPLLLALRAAFEHDSADSLHALTRCRSGDQQLQQPGSLLASCEAPELLARLEAALEQSKLLRKPDRLASGDQASSAGLGLLGLALEWDRWRLAGQLLTARQFDLLPVCLRVMLCLQRWRGKSHPGSGVRLPQQGASLPSAGSATVSVDAVSRSQQPSSEMMDDLYDLAKRTFCGAMVRLHNGSSSRYHQGLVFNYMGGKFHHRPNSSRQHLPQQPHQPDRGPLFKLADKSSRSVFDMMLLIREPDLLALPCATEYVDRLMSSPMEFCCHTCPGGGGDQLSGAAWADAPLRLLDSWWPTEAAKLRRCLPHGLSPKTSMVLTFAFNLAFLCTLGYHVHEIGQQARQPAQLPLNILLLVCAVFYWIQEWQDLTSVPATGRGRERHCGRLRRYFAFRWNLVDIAAAFLLSGGLIAAIVLDGTEADSEGLPYYIVRQVLALSFVFYCLRMLSSLGYYERLGLYISMIKTTFVADVVPFLIVNAFFLVSFGSLIVSLLFPGGRVYTGGQSYTTARTSTPNLPTDDYIAEMFQRPLFAHFGEFDADTLRDCRRDKEKKACPHPLGNAVYSRFLLFVYLLIVSVIFINVLIAKLSLTVSREDERARVIWRVFRAKLLVEFQGASTPPVLLLRLGQLAVRLIARLVRCCCRSSRQGQPHHAGSNGADSASSCRTNKTLSPRDALTLTMEKVNQQPEPQAQSDWWSSPELHRAPEGYQEFLWLQAMQFRSVRHTFAQCKV